MHQYQSEARVDRTMTPGHGRSELTGSRKIWNASCRGSPHVELELWMYVDGMASMYLYCKAISPPTLM